MKSNNFLQWAGKSHNPEFCVQRTVENKHPMRTFYRATENVYGRRGRRRRTVRNTKGVFRGDGKWSQTKVVKMVRKKLCGKSNEYGLYQIVMMMIFKN